MGLRTPAAAPADGDRRVPFVIGALVVLLAVIAAGTGAFRDFTDGVAKGATSPCAS